MAQTIAQMALVEFIRRGYRVRDGCIISKTRNKRKLRVSKRGYQYVQFQFKVNGVDKQAQIFVHRMVAYSKFGREKLFDSGIVVRHFDDVKLKNSWTNIEIGTHKDNMEDAKRNGRI